MALYLVCGSRQRKVYAKMAAEKLAGLLSARPGESPVASFCMAEGLDDRGLPYGGLLLLPEDDFAATDGACDALQKLNLTVAPLVVQAAWQTDCLPGLLLFECAADPGAAFAEGLRAKYRSIVSVHRLSFTRRQLDEARQFHVLVVLLTGGPQALGYERDCLARVICADLRLEQALFAKLSRPELADNPPYVPTVESRCHKTTFLLVRGIPTYAKKVMASFETAFMMTPHCGKYFAILGAVGRRSPAYHSDAERRDLMDQLMIKHQNCRVDEVYVCQLDSNTCMAPAAYAAPPVGLQSSPFLLLVTDAWGPSQATVCAACCGESFGCFFTAGQTRMAMLHFADASNRLSSALALLAIGVQVFAVFINDWIVRIEPVAAGPLRQMPFTQCARPDIRSLVLHCPPLLPPPPPLAPLQSPMRSLLPTPPAPLQSLPRQSSSLPTPLQPPPLNEEEPTSTRSAASLTTKPLSPPATERPASPADFRRCDPPSASSDFDATDLDPGVSMSIDSEEDGELLERAGDAAGRGPRTPSESSADDQPAPQRAGASAVPESASPRPTPSPQPPQQQPMDTERDLLGNVCLEVSPLSASIRRSDVEHLLQSHRGRSSEDWHYVLYRVRGANHQQLLLFAEDPGTELCRCLTQLRSDRRKMPAPQVTRRSISRSEAGARCPLPLRLAVFFRPRGLWLCGVQPGQLGKVLDCVFGNYRQVNITDSQQQSVMLHFDRFDDCINSYVRVTILFLFRLACYLCVGSD